MKAKLFAALGAALLGAGTSAYAHHSFATFDMTKQVTVTGEIKDFQWTNPHIWILIAVPAADGTSTDWSIEGGGPGALVKEGLTKKTLQAGDKVTITVHPLKDGHPGGDFVKVVLPDGKVVGDVSGTRGKGNDNGNGSGG